VDYAVTGPAGMPFVHAAHLLLDVGPTATVEAPDAETMTVFDQPGPGDASVRSWPSGLDALGPDDGSATCALVWACQQVTVVDGDEALRLQWTAGSRSSLCSLLLWRNLGGWPVSDPYRSIGDDRTGPRPQPRRAGGHRTPGRGLCLHLVPTAGGSAP